MCVKATVQRLKLLFLIASMLRKESWDLLFLKALLLHGDIALWRRRLAIIIYTNDVIIFSVSVIADIIMWILISTKSIHVLVNPCQPMRVNKRNNAHSVSGEWRLCQ